MIYILTARRNMKFAIINFDNKETYELNQYFSNYIL